MKFSPLPIAAAALSALALASPSLAQEEASRTVTFNHGALETSDGRAAIERQIRNAAQDVCQTRGLREVSQIQLARACYNEAVEQAMRELDVRAEARLNTRLANRQQARTSEGS
ncbi:MAG: UrcA family protein [Oceanicaulis sp.]|uniref:UrcA family protein n=1 Tax=Glycocaulis sp. TaxID=1969725 RepID=UPI0025BF279D|nr:UrcA family protein [Glycocaulis sp.]MCC5982184.1 UrcA family protein [Oceanicaulis sp.]MCH8520390.1 UrcA family protein [Glycocaulis sp.]